MKKILACLLASALCCISVLITAPTQAAAVRHTQGVLGATDSLVLVIDGVDEQLAAHGLSRARLEQAITSRLQAAGMQVVPESDLSSRESTGVLELRVRLNRAPYFFYLYNINLTLNSKLSLSPGRSAFTTTPTWSDGWVGAMQPTEVGQLQGYAEELLARFLAQRAGEIVNGGN